MASEFTDMVFMLFIRVVPVKTFQMRSHIFLVVYSNFRFFQLIPLMRFTLTGGRGSQMSILSHIGCLYKCLMLRAFK